MLTEFFTMKKCLKPVKNLDIKIPKEKQEKKD